MYSKAAVDSTKRQLEKWGQDQWEYYYGSGSSWLSRLIKYGELTAPSTAPLRDPDPEIEHLDKAIARLLQTYQFYGRAVVSEYTFGLCGNYHRRELSRRLGCSEATFKVWLNCGIAYLVGQTDKKSQTQH